MTRTQASIVGSIFIVCTALISASYLVTGTPRQPQVSSEVLAGFDSLSDAISGTYTRDREVRPTKVASKPQKKRACDPSQQTCVAAKAKPKVETVTYETGYRTLCVRLCDGYYFPISSATSPEHFEADSLSCQSRCNSPARLFVYKNVGGSPETMVDLDGRPYSDLKTAFLHRASRNPSCTCKADPWSEQAANTHRIYALEAQQRNGSVEAATQLALMKSVVRRQISEARMRSGAAELKPVVQGDTVPEVQNLAEARAASEPASPAAPVVSDLPDRRHPLPMCPPAR